MNPIADLIADACEDMRSGRVDTGIKKMGRLLGADPRNPELLNNMALFQQKAGQNGVGIALMERAVDLGLKYWDVWMNLGSMYCQENIHDKADFYFRKALAEKECKRALVLANMAALYVNQDNAEEALRCCNEALAEDPHDDLSKFNRSIALLELGRFEE